jgi:methionyl-tRNA formyltransferase
MHHLRRWVENMPHHEVEIVSAKAELTGGDLLFLISCQEMIRAVTKAMYHYTLVLHASNVPQGKGFAPLNWQILEGQSEITVSMMDAADKVDSGDIFHQVTFENEGHETFEEIFEKLFHAEIELMTYAVIHFPRLQGRPQDSSIESSYYRRRTPEDSRIQVESSIENAFDLLRASDPSRYPVQFEHRGHTYTLRLEKVERVQLVPKAVITDSEQTVSTSHRN